MPPVHNLRLPHLHTTRICNIRKHLRMRQSAPRKDRGCHIRKPHRQVKRCRLLMWQPLLIVCVTRSLYVPITVLRFQISFTLFMSPISVTEFQISLTLFMSLFPVSGFIIPSLPDRLRRRTYAEELPFASSHHRNGFASCRPRDLYLKQASQHIRGSLPALLPHHN